VVGDGVHESWAALRAVGQEKTPEIGAFAGSAEGAPSAAEEREIQEDDRVCGSEANLGGVAGAEVTIHDPRIFRDELLLHQLPFIARHWGKARTPEDFVEFDYWKPRDLA
jgi:hypothetical protein